MTEKELQFNDIKPYFMKMPVVYFASVVENKPRIRPMSLINHKGELWLASRSYDEKIEQIRNNPNFEISFMVQDEFSGMIRASGSAQVVDDLKVKEELIPAISFFKDYFKGYDDPNYGLIKLEVEEVRTLSSGKRCKFEWK